LIDSTAMPLVILAVTFSYREVRGRVSHCEASTDEQS
jgi:hypothetical protein